MAEVKNYGLSGVHRTLQLGKQGPKIVGDNTSDSFSITLEDGTTLTTMSGANATSTEQFITKGQLDVVYTEAVFKANVNYNDSSPILLGNITSGTKTIITTLTIGTAFDDANAVVTIGTAANNSLLMSDNYCEIENTGVYQTINVLEIASNTALNIYVTQAGATAGFGNVLVSVVDGPVVDGGTINYGTGSSGIALTDLSVASNSPSGNGSLSYNNTTGVFTFTPADASLSNYGSSDVVTLLSSFGSNTISTTGNITAGYFIGDGSQLTGVGGNYSNSNVVSLLSSFGSNTISTTGNVSAGYFVGNGSLLTGITAGTNYTNSNVVTLLSSFGSNTISTTGNITAGNVTTADGKHVYLGNASSRLAQLGSNAYIQLSGAVTLIPDTSASATNGVTIGGSGYLLGPNNARNMTLNYGASGIVGFQSNVVLGTAGNASLNVPGITTTGITAIVAGVTNTLLPNTIASFSANVNNYTQVTLQNKSTGGDATADFIITADNGSDTVNFADFGIINSGYDNTTPSNSLGNIVYAADTYLYAQGNASNVSQPGGNIAIGTTVSGKSVKIFAGGANANSIIGTFSSTGLAVNGNVTATNFSGNISITGNVTGTSPNVTLVAGSYSTVIDNTGLATFPGNVTINGAAAGYAPNRPAFRVTGAGTTNNLSNTTNTNGVLNSNNFAVDYNQGSYLNTSTGTFTAPCAGLYQITLVARVSSNNNATSQVAVMKNSSTQQCFWEVSASSTVGHMGVSSIAKLAAGDTLTLKVLLGTINFDTNDHWSVAYIG